MRVFQRRFSVAVNVSSPTMWKTVGMRTLPWASVGRSFRTPYALASLVEYSAGSLAVEPFITRAALEESDGQSAVPAEAGGEALTEPAEPVPSISTAAAASRPRRYGVRTRMVVPFADLPLGGARERTLPASASRWAVRMTDLHGGRGRDRTEPDRRGAQRPYSSSRRSQISLIVG